MTLCETAFQPCPNFLSLVLLLEQSDNPGLPTASFPSITSRRDNLDGSELAIASTHGPRISPLQERRAYMHGAFSRLIQLYQQLCTLKSKLKGGGSQVFLHVLLFALRLFLNTRQPLR